MPLAALEDNVAGVGVGDGDGEEDGALREAEEEEEANASTMISDGIDGMTLLEMLATN
jgi:hypothetical protein